jgi:hypothetical protein
MAKGMKTGGRKAGTPNKVTSDVKALSGVYSAEAVQTLVDLMRDETAPPQTRLAAANSLLDRAHGKPVPVTISDDEDDTRTTDVTIRIVDASLPERG